MNLLEKAPRSRGSALTVVLLVLVLVTAMGISLLLITETELAAGGYERVITRTFYAAESGIGVATAKILVKRECGGFELRVPDSELSSNLRYGYRINVPKMGVVSRQFGNLSMANQANSSEAQFYSVMYVMNSTAERWFSNLSTSQEQQQSGKSILTTVEILPSEQPPTACAAPDDDGTGSTATERNQI